MKCEGCGMGFEPGDVAVRVQTVKMREAASGRVEMKANGWTGDIASTYHKQCIADSDNISETPEHRQYGVAIHGSSGVAHAYDGRVSVCNTSEIPRRADPTKHATAGKLLEAVDCGTCLRVLRSRL